MHWLDPDYLPEVSGTVKQFLVNPHGEIDGMIFKNGTELHFPPHLSGKISKLIAVGEKVKVRGVRPRSSDVIVGVSIETAKGEQIIDCGAPKHRKPGKRDDRHELKPKIMDIETSGVVQRALHGPKGEIRGVLLESGEAIRFPEHEAKKLISLTKPGVRFAVRGQALTTKFGTVINADVVGSSEKTYRKMVRNGSKSKKYRVQAF